MITHFDHYSELDPLYLPSQPGNNPFSDLIASNDPYAFARGYAYNVAPVTDNAPFFFFTLKAGQILGEKGLREGIDWKVNLGVLVLLLVLVISLIAVLAFLVLPLALRSRSGRQSPLPLLYFVAVGLGYILVEIAFIQRFVLFLGHPTYALTVVIFLLMLSSGAGSLLSRRWLPRTELAWVPLVLVIVTLLADVFFLPGRLAALVGMDFGYRLLVSGVLLVPLGFVMGMPFPTGLRALAALPAPEFPRARRFRQCRRMGLGDERGGQRARISPGHGDRHPVRIDRYIGLWRRRVPARTAAFAGTADRTRLNRAGLFVIMQQGPVAIPSCSRDRCNLSTDWHHEDFICLARSSSSGRNCALGSR